MVPGQIHMDGYNMEIIRTIMAFDIIFDNSWIPWIVFTSFFIVAIITRRTDNKIRRKTGNILLGMSIPGMLIVLVSLLMFIFNFFWILGHINFDTGSTGGLGNWHEDFENFSICFFLFPILLFPIQGITSLISGIHILRRGIVKVIAVILIFMGISLVALGIYYLRAFMYFAAD